MARFAEIVTLTRPANDTDELKLRVIDASKELKWTEKGTIQNELFFKTKVNWKTLKDAIRIKIIDERTFSVESSCTQVCDWGKSKDNINSFAKIFEKDCKIERKPAKYVKTSVSSMNPKDTTSSRRNDFFRFILHVIFFPLIILGIGFGIFKYCRECRKFYGRLVKRVYIHSRWRYERKDGEKDMRYKSNPEHRVYTYTVQCKNCGNSWSYVR